MRRDLRPLSLLVLLAAGCERMPEDPVFAYGRLLRVDGSPHEGAVLRVERAVHGGFQDYTKPPIQPSKDFSPYSEGRSEAEGDFTLAFLAGEVFDENRQSYTYTQYRFRAYTPLEDDGSGMFVSFHFRDDVELPVMQPWRAGLAVSDGPEGPALSFAAPLPAPESPPSADLPTYYLEDGQEYTVAPTAPEPVVQLHAGGGLVWQQQGVASPWVASPYVLEDFTSVEGQVRAVSAGTWYFQPLASNGSNMSFRLEWRSPRLPVPGGALRPVSRGAACSPMPEDVSGPCPYTDGRLEAVETRRHDPVNEAGDLGVDSLTFTLAAPVLPRRAVVRGLETTLAYLPRLRLVLEGSADGATWAPLADHPVAQFELNDLQRATYGFSLTGTEWDSPWDGPLDVYNAPLWLEVPLTGSTPVRHVRLRVKADGVQQYQPPERIWGLTELSLFE